MLRQNIKRWIKKKENLLVEFLGILFWVIVAAGALCLYFSGILDLLTLLQVLFGLLLASLPIYLHLVKKREQMLLLGFTARFLLEKDEAKIDELLGILIAGKWEKLKLDPIEEFFGSLEGLCLKGSFEMRRRIAEALPALFKLDLEKSKELAGILRHDWDAAIWKSDNRRRAIEAMSYIVKKEKKFVRDNLHLVDKDEIYTIIAIVELIDAWREKVNREEGERLFADVEKEMREKGYSDDEVYAVSELWNLLRLTHSDTNAAARRFEELKDTPNVYLQICIARNLRRLCKGFPRCRARRLCNGSPSRILDLMAFFIQEDKNKNVRRPIAKEESLECLAILLRYKSYSEKAKEIIWALINDKDDIIRLSAFDKIESILEIDPTFGMRILQHVIASDHHPELVERAMNLRRRLSEELKL